ncbi:hypothetical protein TU81_27765 [Pseudomonas lini]|nr:hypothetical protein TU81_27765 [Pseudomonas lini]KNH46406.1 hypothetical protein ACS73_10765 [Pseudomonas lini]
MFFLDIAEDQDQKIAAFGSSYIEPSYVGGSVYGFTISGGWEFGGSSRGGGVVPGGSCSGMGPGSVGGVGGMGGIVGSSMFGSGVSAGIGILIETVSSGRWRESCLS